MSDASIGTVNCEVASMSSNKDVKTPELLISKTGMGSPSKRASYSDKTGVVSGSLEEHLCLTGQLGAAHLFSSMVTKLKFNPPNLCELYGWNCMGYCFCQLLFDKLPIND